MMTFEQFVTEVERNIGKYLSEENKAKGVVLREVEKLNARYTGITLQGGAWRSNTLCQSG